MPGPRGSRLFGTGVLFRRDLLGTLLGGMRDYGDTVRYEVLPLVRPLRETLVVAHHPDDVRQVLARTERSLTKRTIGFEVLAEMVGLGLLTTEGEVWRRQRRTLQPLFTPRRVTRYAALMAEEADRLELPPEGGVVDLNLAMRRYTLRVVGKALFSEDIDDTVPALHRLVPRLSDLTVRRTFQLARIPLRFPTPRNLAVRRIKAQEYAIVDRILARVSDADSDDLLTRLRAARDPETGEGLSEQEIRDQVLVFLLAGHETTSGALTFALHLLGRHPEEQEAVAAEVASVSGGTPGPDDVPRLVRTRAALLEAMRLYPPAYLTERRTVEETIIGGHAVPGGVMVLVAPWSTHRHPEFWPDPERFDPGRFVGEHERPHYAYFPFGGGPRACVGEHFALLEATILLAGLLSRYRVAALEPELAVEPLITLRPRGSVWARLAPRRGHSQTAGGVGFDVPGNPSKYR